MDERKNEIYFECMLKKLPHYHPNCKKIKLKHNAEAAIIVTCDITTINLTLSFLSAEESS